jgi:hypothetical protein
VLQAEASLSDQIARKLAQAGEKNHRGERYWVAAEVAYYMPAAHGGRALIVAPPEAIADIIDLGGDPPPMRRDIERLLTHTDANRCLTIVVAPNSLFSEGGSVFRDMPRLRDALFWFLGDELSAVAVSLHWDENFFIELLAVPTLDTSPQRAARILMQRLAEIPGKIEQYLAVLKPQPYGQPVLERFPAMLRTMVAYTRSGVEDQTVVLRCYLPAVAGHNLLAGAELALAEPPGGMGSVAEAAAPARPASTPPVSASEGLHRVTSLRFTRDTLEAALERLSEDMGVPVVIRGADLQAEGITKNQSFGIDLIDKPAEEILVEILRLANPDKTATGPGDVRQKLVYIISASGEGAAEQVVVTTRAAAAERGDVLPAVFMQDRP